MWLNDKVKKDMFEAMKNKDTLKKRCTSTIEN